MKATNLSSTGHKISAYEAAMFESKMRNASTEEWEREVLLRMNAIWDRVAAKDGVDAAFELDGGELYLMAYEDLFSEVFAAEIEAWDAAGIEEE